MTKYAQKYVRRKKKAVGNGGGSREEEESRGLGVENRDPAREGVGDGRPQRHGGGNNSRKRRVCFAREEETEEDEGGGSKDEAVAPCVTEGTVNFAEYQSPMKLRSRDRGWKRKVMCGDSEDDGDLAKKRMRRRKGISEGGVVEVHEAGANEKEKGTSARKRAVKNLDVAGEGTVRERGLGTGKCSGRPNKHDPKWLEEECRMCHQCQRSDKDRIVRCKSCKRKRFCAPCIKNWYPTAKEEEVHGSMKMHVQVDQGDNEPIAQD